MSVGTIVYSKPSQNLPLSAEMCLNESFMLYNDTMVTTAVTTHDVTLWNETQIPLADTTEAGDIYRFVVELLETLSYGMTWGDMTEQIRAPNSSSSVSV